MSFINNIWFDDAQYFVEAIDGDFAVTEVSEDGRGSDVTPGRAAAVIEACDADERRRSA